MAEKITVYLDVCCLNRPFDDQSHDRIRLESEAVIGILKHIEGESWQWESSDVVLHEVRRTPDEERRDRILNICGHATRVQRLTDQIIKRAKVIEPFGIDAYDALHVACAEIARVDVFLTTDDKLLSRLSDHGNEIGVVAENPLDWFQRVIGR